MAAIDHPRGEPRRAFVVGAGIVGLAAATRLAERVLRSRFTKPRAKPAERCRSYYDPALDQTIEQYLTEPKKKKKTKKKKKKKEKKKKNIAIAGLVMLDKGRQIDCFSYRTLRKIC